MKTLAFAAMLLPLISAPPTSSAWARDRFALERSSFPGEPDFAPPEASACPGDAVVWINLRSGLYYGAEDHAYGRTIQGAYMCRQAAARMGYAEKRAER